MKQNVFLAFVAVMSVFFGVCSCSKYDDAAIPDVPAGTVVYTKVVLRAAVDTRQQSCIVWFDDKSVECFYQMYDPLIVAMENDTISFVRVNGESKFVGMRFAGGANVVQENDTTAYKKIIKHKVSLMCGKRSMQEIVRFDDNTYRQFVWNLELVRAARVGDKLIYRNEGELRAVPLFVVL